MSAQRPRPVRLEDSEHTHSPGTERIGPADHAHIIHVVVVLRRRPDGPPLPGMEYYQRTPPGQRERLSHEEAGRRFGASPEDIEAIAGFAAEHDLRVVEASEARRTVDLAGTVEKLNHAFGVTLMLYRRAGESYHGHDGAIHLPAEIVGRVVAVFGLDSRTLAARAGGPAITLSSLTPPQVANLYGFPPPPPSIGAQTIGIFEFSGGYAIDGSGNPTDIDAFYQGLNPPLPKPTLTPPVLVMGGSNTVLGSKTSVSNSDAEVVLDVDVAGSVAPGVTIAVYFIGSNSEVGWLKAITTAILPTGTEPTPSVITISWAWDETSWSAANLKAISSFFQLAAFQNVTVFAASGDVGSMGNATQPDGRAHVCYPAIDPWVTAVGGTTIGNVSGSSFTEITWNDNGVTAGGISTVTDSSGALVFPLPAWQAAAGVPPSVNDGTTRGRGIPDIAGYSNGYDIQLYGADGGFWVGTSEASPLYAGLVALLNARLGFSLGYLNPTLYGLAETPGLSLFNDIADGGSNAFTFTLPPPSPPTIITSPGYKAITGWDACTGWGSLRADRLFKKLAGLPSITAAIANSGAFADTCVGRFSDETLTINNSGFGLLAISGISSSVADFLAPGVTSSPLLVAPADSIDVMIRFQPLSGHLKHGTILVSSNDPSGPLSIAVSGSGQTPRIALALADSGDFGPCCPGHFVDRPLLINNDGHCPLAILDVTSSDPNFVVPDPVIYPLSIAPGATLPLPIRFAPKSHGPKTAKISVNSNAASGQSVIDVSGHAPHGRLVITGSSDFGEVCCDRGEERTVWLCNTGPCPLHLREVRLYQPHHAFRLINPPAPGPLPPGASLAITLHYEAHETMSYAGELVIESDDPDEPCRRLAVCAKTRCGCCDKPIKSCGCGCCDER